MDGAERYKSTVEIYRTPGNRYEREPLPYDMSDPLDIGVWVGLCMYTRYIDGDGEQDGRSAGLPSPWELEQDLNDLSSNARAVLGHSAHERLSSRVAVPMGLTVLRALFTAAATGSGDDEQSRDLSGPRVPPDLWRTSSGWLKHLEATVVLADSENTSAGDVNYAAAEHGDKDVEDLERREGYEELLMAQLGRPLVTVVYMARLALGGTITQSEAARRLGVTPVRVYALVAQGRLSHVRVGRTVLLLEEEISAGLADRRRNNGFAL